jgi:hypothetical protein
VVSLDSGTELVAAEFGEGTMTAFALTGDALWERMERAVEKVRERLERAASAMEQAAIPYAVAGGNAVGAWVAQVDEAAVRNTRDVEELIANPEG